MAAARLLLIECPTQSDAPQRSFSYDALGRLTGVSGPTLSASYTLDGDGNRVSETVNSVSTDFDLDLRGLPTVLVAGDRSFLPGMPSLGHAQSGDWHSYLADAQGSVLGSIDGPGITSTLARYDPFGGLRPGSTASVGIGYTGEWTDPSGLVNLRFRAYDPSVGRFISRDTFGGLLTVPQSSNRHAYTLGNPLRYTDPSGHFVSGGLIPGGQGVVDSFVGFGEGFINLGLGTIGWAWDAAVGLPGAALDWANNFDQRLAGTFFHLSDVARDFGPNAGQALIDLGGYIGSTSEACRVGDIRTCTRFGTDVALMIAGPKLIKEGIGATVRLGEAGSGLATASRLAFRAADRVNEWTVSRKHLPGAGGHWAKFAGGVDPRSLVQQALRSSAAEFRPGGAADRFLVRTDLGFIVGTKGETAVRVVVSSDGRIITAFPVR